MKPLSIQKSAVASLILHSLLFFAVFLMGKRFQHHTMPSGYTVSLVSEVKAPPAAKTPSKEAQPSQESQEETPAKEISPPVDTVKPEIKKSIPQEKPQATIAEKPVEKPIPEPKPQPKPIPEPKPEPKPIPEPKQEIPKPEKKIPEAKKDLPKPEKKIPEPTKEAIKEKPEPTQVAKKTDSASKPATQSKETSSASSAQTDRAVDKRIAELMAKKRVENMTSKRALASVGGATGGGRLGSPLSGANSPAMDQYMQMVERQVRQNWVYPNLGDKEIEAIVTFIVKRDGSIAGMRLEKSSGNSFFDRTALSAVAKSTPLPTPPNEMEVGIRFYP